MPVKRPFVRRADCPKRMPFAQVVMSKGLLKLGSVFHKMPGVADYAINWGNRMVLNGFPVPESARPRARNRSRSLDRLA